MMGEKEEKKEKELKEERMDKKEKENCYRLTGQDQRHYKRSSRT